MIEDGADWIDIGAYSSRPGALEVTAEEETAVWALAWKPLRKVDSDIFVSVGYLRAEVADIAVKRTWRGHDK